MSIRKYEKIDPNNMKIWDEGEVLNKQNLQAERNDLSTIIALSNNVLEQVLGELNSNLTLSEFQALLVAKQDFLDAQLALLNNTTTEQCIDFIDE